MAQGKVVLLRAALMAASLYAVCVLYDLAAPASHHPRSWMELLLPGFHVMSVPGFVVGLVESIAYGVAVGTLFALVRAAVRRRRVTLAADVSHEPSVSAGVGR